MTQASLAASAVHMASSRPNVAAQPSSDATPLQRVRTVRWQQGLSLRTVARRAGLSLKEVQRLEREESDMPLSVLYQLQRALEVPVSHLLVDSDDVLSEPVRIRAQLVKAMKSVASILQDCQQESVCKYANQLRQELVEVMPELGEVMPWPSVGQRRSGQELGKIAESPIPDHAITESYSSRAV